MLDDEDDYDEAGGGNRLLGFMFGNVDGSGDLDVDYLDEVRFFSRHSHKLLTMYIHVCL